MPIPITCSSCYHAFRVADHLAGRRGLCPQCDEVVLVPNPDLSRLEPIDDPEDSDAGYGNRPRRSRRKAITPADHLPAWRRVSFGFLLQQLAAIILLIAIGLLLLSMLLLADDPADMDADRDMLQMIASGLAILAGLLGVGLQATGRFLSAGTPVSAPRFPGWTSAIISTIQLPAGCLLGLFAVVIGVQQQQGQADPAAVMLVGLGMFGCMAISVGAEAFHCFAVGSVGRVLRADGVKTFGRGLGIYVLIAATLAMMCACLLGAWAENQNPGGQNPAAAQEEDQIFLVWAVAVGALSGLYLLLDLVLLQQSRGTISRLDKDSEPDESRADSDSE